MRFLILAGSSFPSASFWVFFSTLPILYFVIGFVFSKTNLIPLYYTSFPMFKK